MSQDVANTARVPLMPPRPPGETPRENAIRLFWSKPFDIDANGCWNWTRSKMSAGYGNINVTANKKKHNFRVHRLSYEIHFGEIPKGVGVLHSCDNPACCNPEHLTLGTHKKNMHEMAKKGRAAGWHRRCKYIGEIKGCILAGMTNNEIGERFGVHPTMVSLIRRGKRHAEVTPVVFEQKTSRQQPEY